MKLKRLAQNIRGEHPLQRKRRLGRCGRWRTALHFRPGWRQISIGRLPCDFLLGCCRHQLIAKFFRSDSQAFDVLLLVSFFERFCPLIDIRLAPPEQAVDQARQARQLG